MADIPIIFSAPMVLALLAGRKTMTRRLAWRQTIASPEKPRPGASHSPDGYSYYPTPWQRAKVGDRLWVREGFCFGPADENPIYYRATDQVQSVQDGDGFAILNKDGSEKSPWRSALHMPRYASRLTLFVTSTKTEPVQNISDEDAKAEGASEFLDIPSPPAPHWAKANRWSMESPTNTDQCLGTPHFAFANYWIKLHGPASWEANPEVVALGLKVHKTNIDELKQAA